MSAGWRRYEVMPIIAKLAVVIAVALEVTIPKIYWQQ